MENIARHVIFSGRVQGVGFRYTAHRSALKFGVTGYVKNLPDENVEMFVQGHPVDVTDCLKEINEMFSTYIKEAQIEDVPVNYTYESFLITF